MGETNVHATSASVQFTIPSTLDPSEYASSDDVFNKVDANGDGYITLSEWKNCGGTEDQFNKTAGYDTAQITEGGTTTARTSISKTELKTHYDFQKIDADKDGNITYGEWADYAGNGNDFSKIAGSETIEISGGTHSVITEDELQSYNDSTKVDTNNDGSISHSEWIRQGLDPALFYQIKDHANLGKTDIDHNAPITDTEWNDYINNKTAVDAATLFVNMDEASGATRDGKLTLSEWTDKGEALDKDIFNTIAGSKGYITKSDFVSYYCKTDATLDSDKNGGISLDEWTRQGRSEGLFNTINQANTKTGKKDTHLSAEELTNYNNNKEQYDFHANILDSGTKGFSITFTGNFDLIDSDTANGQSGQFADTADPFGNILMGQKYTVTTLTDDSGSYRTEVTGIDERTGANTTIKNWITFPEPGKINVNGTVCNLDAKGNITTTSGKKTITIGHLSGLEGTKNITAEETARSTSAMTDFKANTKSDGFSLLTNKMKDGKQFVIVLDGGGNITSDKWSAYNTANFNNDNYLALGHTYTVSYKDGKFYTTGYNRYYNKIGTGDSDGSPDNATINVFGEDLTFNAAGDVMGKDGQKIGHITFLDSPGDNTSAISNGDKEKMIDQYNGYINIISEFNSISSSFLDRGEASPVDDDYDRAVKMKNDLESKYKDLNLEDPVKPTGYDYRKSHTPGSGHNSTITTAENITEDTFDPLGLHNTF